MKENKGKGSVHKEGAMAEFNEGHWQEKVPETEVGNGRYASEMNAKEELKKSVDGLAGYVKKHKAQH